MGACVASQYRITEPMPWEPIRMNRLGDDNYLLALTALREVAQHTTASAASAAVAPAVPKPRRSDPSAPGAARAAAVEGQAAAGGDGSRVAYTPTSRAKGVLAQPVKRRRGSKAAAKGEVSLVKRYAFDPLDRTEAGVAARRAAWATAEKGKRDAARAASQEDREKTARAAEANRERLRKRGIQVPSPKAESATTPAFDKLSALEAAYQDPEVEQHVVEDVKLEVELCYQYVSVKRRRKRNRLSHALTVDEAMERRVQALIYTHCPVLPALGVQFRLRIDFDELDRRCTLPLSKYHVLVFHRAFASLGGDKRGVIDEEDFCTWVNNEAVRTSFQSRLFGRLVETSRSRVLDFYEFVESIHTYMTWSERQQVAWLFKQLAFKSGEKVRRIQATTTMDAKKHGKEELVLNLTELIRRHPSLSPDLDQSQQNPFDQQLLNSLSGNTSGGRTMQDAATLAPTASGFVRVMQRQIEDQRDNYRAEHGIDSDEEEKLGWHGPDGKRDPKARDRMVGQSDFRAAITSSTQCMYVLSYWRTFFALKLFGEDFWHKRGHSMWDLRQTQKEEEMDEKYKAYENMSESTVLKRVLGEDEPPTESIDPAEDRARYMTFFDADTAAFYKRRDARTVDEVRKELKGDGGVVMVRDKKTGKLKKQRRVSNTDGGGEEESKASGPRRRSWAGDADDLEANSANTSAPARRRSKASVAAKQVGWDKVGETAAAKRRRKVRQRRRSAAT